MARHARQRLRLPLAIAAATVRVEVEHARAGGGQIGHELLEVLDARLEAAALGGAQLASEAPDEGVRDELWEDALHWHLSVLVVLGVAAQLRGEELEQVGDQRRARDEDARGRQQRLG